ncbi:uncharacterized protein LOC100882346 [Megachile rotundata]|uniref:uncharacterized protein LOC100882346 n=1 Tax=Megachile rotundata TaxID=143995 RepID=UPI003FD08BBC
MSLRATDLIVAFGPHSWKLNLLGSCRSQECGHERLVKCGRPFEMINNNDLSFATKKEDLQQLCPDLEAGIKCIQTYTFECMKEKQREHFNSLYTGTNKVVMELCQDGPYQDEFLRHAACMQKVQPEYELCYKKYHRTTQEIERRNHTASLNGSLKALCCGFKEFLECSHHSIRRQCGDDTAQFAKQFLDRMSSSLLKISYLISRVFLDGRMPPQIGFRATTNILLQWLIFRIFRNTWQAEGLETMSRTLGKSSRRRWFPVAKRAKFHGRWKMVI